MLPVTSQTVSFNRTDVFATGWYWVAASSDVRPGDRKPIRILGRDLVVWRARGGSVHVMDAYCPHMGAHLAEGQVDGEGLRCFFHAWKFDVTGQCVDIPCQSRPVDAKVRSWPTAEHYGLIWVWTGDEPTRPPPFVPELEHTAWDAQVAGSFEKHCHPNVMMINAIDAQHFASVHRLPVQLNMERRDLHEHAVTFSNTVPPRDDTRFGRFLQNFYSGPITYSLCYWYGSTGSVTLGPDFLHFHILFALRMTDGGRAEGRTILVTRARPGWWGWLKNRVLLALTWFVGTYFAQGDTRVFQTIRFNFKTPIKADKAIVGFVKHYDAQPSAQWGSWEPLEPSREGAR
jgi:phenylpropionate dioxygenase-like ring-hydroxylating dioxygenase large terminal subunit